SPTRRSSDLRTDRRPAKRRNASRQRKSADDLPSACPAPPRPCRRSGRRADWSNPALRSGFFRYRQRNRCSCFNSLNCRIEGAIAPVGIFEGTGETCIRFDRGLGCRGGANGERISASCGDQPKTRRAEGGSKITVGGNIDRYAERSRDDLQPIARARATANGGDAVKHCSGGL